VTITVTCYLCALSAGDHLFTSGAISILQAAIPKKGGPEASASLAFP